MSHKYVPVVYGLSLWIAEFLWVAMGSVIMVILMYFLLGFRYTAQDFFAFLLLQYLNGLCFNGFGHRSQPHCQIYSS